MLFDFFNMRRYPVWVGVGRVKTVLVGGWMGGWVGELAGGLLGGWVGASACGCKGWWVEVSVGEKLSNSS